MPVDDHVEFDTVEVGRSVAPDPPRLADLGLEAPDEGRRRIAVEHGAGNRPEVALQRPGRGDRDVGVVAEEGVDHRRIDRRVETDEP